MKIFAKFFACVLLMDQVYSDNFDDFKVHVLGEIKTLKENNAKKDQEIASLKISQEEMTSAIQNNIANVDYLTYYSTLMNVPQTCQELGSRGVDRSGSFPINPDGSGSNGLPITVSCDFPSGKTILGEAEEIEVNQCDTVLCFPHEVETDFPQSQITALMEASLTCSQKVTYSCLSAPWKAYGKDYLLIMDRDGQNHTLEDFGSTENCNSVSFTELSDSVTIKDINLLPIKGFRYGPLPHSNQKVTLTIGPIICTPPVEPFKTTLVRQIDVIQATLNDHDSKFDVEMVKINETLQEFRTDIENLKGDISNDFEQPIQTLNDQVKFRCPTEKPGFRLLANRCYFFDKVTRSYTDTLEKCKSAFGPKVQGKMVEPMSLQINNLIFEEAKSIFSGRFRYWIGITNGGDFKYQSDGSSVTWEMPFFTGQKKDSFSSTECIYLYSLNEGWNSYMPCTRTDIVYPVCEVETD